MVKMAASPVPVLEYSTLVQVLHAAQEPHEAARKPAEDMLKCWEPLAQYPSSLYAVVGDAAVGEPTRVLAAVCLKQCLSKFWRRKLESGGLSDQVRVPPPHAGARARWRHAGACARVGKRMPTPTDFLRVCTAPALGSCHDMLLRSLQDKGTLRTELIRQLNIEHSTIAKQLSVIVAKIARSDWPDEWPNLFPQLLSAVQEGTGLPRLRALMFIHASVKELSARVVGPTRKHLADAAPPIFVSLFRLWTEARAHALSDRAAAEV